MIGAILGDIIGSPYEFDRGSKSKDFPLFSEESTYTDDTVMTLAVAKAFLEAQPDAADDLILKNLADSMRQFGKMYPYAGYGGRFRLWLRNPEAKAYYSFGNGAAMRVSPVGWWCQEQEAVLEQARETAIFSHNHPEGIKGAQTVAYAIWFLRHTKDLAAFRRNIDAIYPGFMRDYPVGVFDETCQGTVPVACKIICEASSFEDAIRRAILQGGDSDTLGAITGSIAEAIWEIPKEILNFVACYLTDEMADVVCRFYSALQNSERY